MNGSGQLYLDRFVNGSLTQVVPTGVTLTAGTWHTFRVSESIGTSAGSVGLTMDGTSLASASGINIGSRLINGFALGEIQPQQINGSSGAIYFNNVYTTSP